MSKRATYAWDAAVFIAWLRQEQTAPLLDIELVVLEIDDNKCNLIVSVTTFTEVLQAKHTTDQMDQFERFLKRSNVVMADSTIVIAKRAEQIRSAGLADGRKIRTPDALHLATAVLYNADAFHTLDDKLIELNGSPVVSGLQICKPKLLSGQASLF